MDEVTAQTSSKDNPKLVTKIRSIIIVYLIILVIYFAVLVYSILDLIYLPIRPYTFEYIRLSSSTFWFLEGHCYFIGAQDIFGYVWMFILLSIIVLNFLLNQYHLLKNQKKGLLIPVDGPTASSFTVFDMVSVLLFCLLVYTVIIIHQLKLSPSIDFDEIIGLSVLIVIPSCISIVFLPRVIHQPREIQLLLIGYQVFFLYLIGSNVLINPICD